MNTEKQSEQPHPEKGGVPMSESRLKEIVGDLLLSRIALEDQHAALAQENAVLRQQLSELLAKVNAPKE